MRLSLGFSPCPNDTFMFDALVNQKIDTEGLAFDLHIADVEALNKMCIEGKMDICKLSYHAFTKTAKNYQMLTAGSALGRGLGPLLISKMPYNFHDVDHLRIAIPGEHTTAAFLLKIAFPNTRNIQAVEFSEIEQMVLNDEVDAGVIIHENRFTYEAHGLLKIIDLGEFWQSRTNLPIPLGGISVKRSLSEELKTQINELVQKSVEYAFENPESSAEYVSKYAQEMDPKVLAKHIHTYVNPFSIHLGDEGKNAVYRMFQEKYGDKFKKSTADSLFV